MKKHRWYVRWFCKFLRLWMPPPEVARMMNVPRQTIWRWSPGKNPAFGKRKEKAIPLLGTISDSAIARKVGLSATSVFNLRLKLGIDPHIPPLSTKKRAVLDRNNRKKLFAERQVNQELMASWKSP